MDWLFELVFPTGGHLPVAHSILILMLVAAAGLALGSIRVLGVSLGVAGVLFAGLLFGHFGLTIDPDVLEFVREFGLILFVYTIGLQVGPGFLASLRRQGLKLNLLCLTIILGGAAVTVALHFLADLPMPAAAGLFSGATTNTPSLAAAQQALRDKTGLESAVAIPGLGYAISYPLGVLGVILTLVSFRFLFRVDLTKEKQLFLSTELESKPSLDMRSIEVTNRGLEGKALCELPLREQGVVVSRLMRAERVTTAGPETRLCVGDVILAVGPRNQLDAFRAAVGKESATDLLQLPSSIGTRQLIVTHKPALGRSIDELGLGRHGVTVTRITRADIELPVSPQVKLQFGDTVLAVGEPEGLAEAARALGNSPKALNYPMLIPVFVGIALGVALGSWPIHLPGLPAPVKLGIATGPMLLAMLFSRIGKIGPLVWFMPTSANFMLRELGISLFLACVGLRSGGRVVETIVAGDGLRWMALSLVITTVPIVLVGLFARLVMKMNYLTLCGLLAGSMTDPPALAFATSSTGSDAPSIAYATTYPTTMIVRVLVVQVLVLLLA